MGFAPHLAKQDYWPATSKETCDLLLVVSWGVTSAYDWRDYYPDFYDSGFFDDYVYLSWGINEMERRDNLQAARLIGFYPFLNWDRYDARPFVPSKEYELRQALRTERYFMIVTAFDFQTLLAKKQWNRVWSTRFSMRSPGINFYRAHLALSKAGGNYFGQDLDKLGSERANFDPVEAEVEIGEIEVLETIDAHDQRGLMQSVRLRDSRR